MSSGTSVYQAVASAGDQVRSLSDQDLPAMVAIERASYRRPWAESIFRDCFRPDYQLWGVESDGRLRGYAVVACLFDEAHLLNLCLHPDDRRRGIGRCLLRHAIKAAFDAGMARMILEVRRSNIGAQHLYESEGFLRIGERPGYYPDVPEREDAVVLSLEAPGSRDRR
ncbi:ribosomal protein S18-alanine N-acetyltransferase [Tamilnaduibacter salinus]|nr:ribosomal protein S18-alanine N-acetyltransferase [Tamilnaduibacter salinus]